MYLTKFSTAYRSIQLLKSSPGHEEPLPPSAERCNTYYIPRGRLGVLEFTSNEYHVSSCLLGLVGLPLLCDSSAIWADEAYRKYFHKLVNGYILALIVIIVKQYIWDPSRDSDPVIPHSGSWSSDPVSPHSWDSRCLSFSNSCICYVFVWSQTL